MASNIDTTALSALITEFRNLQAKDSITPESLGYLLQRIVDLLGDADLSNTGSSGSSGSSESSGSSSASDSAWYNAMKTALPYIAQIVQTGEDPDQVLLSPTLVSPTVGEAYTGDTPISIQTATSEKAGVMSAQQVSDLNSLKDRYSDTVTPAVDIANKLNQSFSSLYLTQIDDLNYANNNKGRLVKVISASGYTDGYLMHITCYLYVTQIFFTHCSLDENGQIETSTHDEKGFHIYKRYKTLSGSNWSAWQLVGGDEFSEVKNQVASMLGISGEASTLAAKGQIAVEIVDGQLRVYGSRQLAAAGYVPYLFRHTRRRNRDKNHLEEGKYTYNEESKGWHLYGSRHSVKVTNTVAYFNTNLPNNFHMIPRNYSDDPINLVHPHTREDGHISIPWGRAMIRLYDKRALKNRMVKLRFGIGYAKPFDHGTGKLNLLNLVSNLAEFSVVYDPRKNEFNFSR